MRQAEPPSSSKSSPFLIGQNSRGNWVVRDQRGLSGGIFIDRAEAIRFAMFENGDRPQAVIMVAGVFELDMSRRPGTALDTDGLPTRSIPARAPLYARAGTKWFEKHAGPSRVNTIESDGGRKNPTLIRAIELRLRRWLPTRWRNSRVATHEPRWNSTDRLGPWSV
jgi:hypothetical protein